MLRINPTPLPPPNHIRHVTVQHVYAVIAQFSITATQRGYYAVLNVGACEDLSQADYLCNGQQQLLVGLTWDVHAVIGV